MTDERPPVAQSLDLQPHPEGGWFRQTWAAPEVVTLPDGRRRPTATLIYFFLPAGASSAWHRLASDETWLAHEGTVLLELGGERAEPATEDVHQLRVGLDRSAGDVAQALVPAGVWQRTVPTSQDALVSCLVSPGFDFDDFELAPVATPFEVKPTLVGDLVTLRPIRAEDADLLAAIIGADEEIARLTGSVHRSDQKPMDLPIERLREIYGEWATAKDRLVLGVVDNASGNLVGEVVLNNWDEGNRSCDFRTLIGAAGRGRGLGTEATRLIVHHGLRTIGLHRISLEVYDFNPRARHVYEKVGFVHEGIGRDALLFDDTWVDVHYMAIVGD